MMKTLVVLFSVLCLAASPVMAAEYDTYSGTFAGWWNLSANGGVAVQHFTVPEGEVGTTFAMLAEIGAASNPGYHCIVQIFSASGNYMGVGVKTADQFAVTDHYVYVENLTLASGQYYAQMFTNDVGFAGYIHTALYSDSEYEGGYAAAGWNGGTPVGDGMDFRAILTTEPAAYDPEVALIGWYDDRWGDQGIDDCVAAASEIVSGGATAVLPYLSGATYDSCANHVSAAGAFGLNLIFEFNRYNVNLGDTSAILAYVAAFENHPGVYGWYTADEPYGNSTPLAPLVTTYNAIKANSSKPVFIAFNSGDIANNTPVTYAAAYDILIADHYILASGDPEFDDFANWKTFIANAAAQAQTAGKILWTAPQAYGTTSGYPLSFTMRLPSYTEERFMTFWSVLEGAKGVLFWSRTPCLYSIAQLYAPYDDDGVAWTSEVASSIMNEFNGCACAIQDGEVAGVVSDDSTDVVSKVYMDTATEEYFLIAANSTTGTENVTFTFTLPAGYTTAVPMNGVDPMVDISSGTLSVTLGDYGVATYRLMPDEQVINTYSGSSSIWWQLAANNGVAVQHFTVPAGTMGTTFEMLAEIGTAYNSGYHCNVVVYSADGTLMGVGSKTATEFMYSNEYVAVENLTLEPGKYYAEMFTNDGGFAGYIHARLLSGSEYAGGYAADDWGGAGAIGSGMDFDARVTVVPYVAVPLLPGDANEDGSVDVGDLGILAANYGTTSGATWSTGDFNGDGAVDVGDLGILAANYGSSSSEASDFDADYAAVFGDDADQVEAESDAFDFCGSLGLPLIAGLALMGLMLVKLED